MMTVVAGRQVMAPTVMNANQPSLFERLRRDGDVHGLVLAVAAIVAAKLHLLDVLLP